MSGAYDGLRVVDFTHIIAGPFCTRLLADHGADVVKVEPFAGDVMRQLKASYAPDLSSAFAQYNCGKRSIAIDLKSERGHRVVLDLIAWADVVVENFALGTLDRLDLGYERMREVNRDVILCSISSFGSYGPYSPIPGYGVVAEAYSGLMSLASDEGSTPTHFGTPLADMNSGTHALAAIGAALYRRERSGEGTHIDISCFDTLVAMIDQSLSLEAFTHGEQRMDHYGSRHNTVVPSSVVRVGNGDHVTYGAVGDVFFRRFAAAMERPDLADDARFRTNDDRVANRHELYDMIEAWALGFPDGASLVARLAQDGIPSARVRAVAELSGDPHLVARGTLAPIDIPGVGRVLLQTAPHPMTGADVAPRGAAPHLGEHTRDVLEEILGLDAASVDGLIADDVVRAAAMEVRA